MEPSTVLLTAAAAFALVFAITLGIKLAGCAAALLMIALPAAAVGFGVGHFYNENAGIASGVIVALMVLLLIRKPRKK